MEYQGRKYYLILTLGLSLLGLVSCRHMADQQPAQQQPEQNQKPGYTLADRMPIDQAVTVKKLANGLTYYLRANNEPRNTIELRLVVNAGSVLEDEGEQGLAHFVEHMAFNGTQHFKKNEIVDYLESIGIRYGPELNARTSMDSTVYQLQVPAENEKAVHTALQILLDWAFYINFEEEEVNKERQVIIEEWRTRQGAGERIQAQHYPVLFKGSAYARRRPIGQLSVLENVKQEQLVTFYKKWYRPELMSIMIVGDFTDDTGGAPADKQDGAPANPSAGDPGAIKKITKKDLEGLIHNYFASLPASKQPVKRPFIPVPNHKQTLYSIAADKELSASSISLYVKEDVKPFVTRGDYRERLLWYLYANMVNNRLDEITKKPDAPFTNASTGRSNFVRSTDVTFTGATVQESDIIRGFKALLTESGKAQALGFNASELDRAKADLFSSIENAYLEREQTPSDAFVEEYIRHYLEGDPIPGVTYEYELFKAYLPAVTLEELNKLAKGWLGRDNRVVLVSVPDKAGLAKPVEAELAKVFTELETTVFTPYEDTSRNEPLLTAIPAPGTIVSETTYEKIGFTRWELSNGVDVWVKPTEFKKNELVFEAFSPGGLSLVKDKDYIPAITAASVARDGGLGNFSKVELDRKLAGLTVSLDTYIDELFEGMSGGAAPKDLETLFQLIYLRFMPPRQDEQAYLAYRDRLRARFVNRRSEPKNVFGDMLRSLLAREHWRSRPITPEVLEEMSMERSLAVYQDRFADASDFTFVFTGYCELATMKEYAVTYLANLPGLKRQENWLDLNIDPPPGVVKKTINLGQEPVSEVELVFHGEFRYSEAESYYITAMADILQTRLREKIREEEGGTYSIGVFPLVQKYPDTEYQIYIGFTCDPKRVEELVQVVFNELEWLKTGPLDESYLLKFKEIQKRQIEKGERENGFWLNELAASLRRQEDPERMLIEKDLLTALKAENIRAAAKTYLDTGRFVQLMLYPEISAAGK